MASPSSRPQRQRKNVRRMYFEESSDSDHRPTLRDRGTRPDYAISDSSSIDSNSDGGLSVEIPTVHSTPVALRRIPTRSTAPLLPKRKLSKKPNTFSSFKRLKLHGPSAEKHIAYFNDGPRAVARSDGKIPPWQTLEHDILTEIFKKASFPLVTNYVYPTQSVAWLRNISYLSRSFHDAAIRALLYCPPLVPYAGGLLNLLRMDQTRLTTNYQVKTRKLVIDAKHLLVKKSTRIPLPELVAHTPFLESLRIVSYLDNIPAVWTQSSAARKTYRYETSLFEALQNSCPRLEEFEWNGRFAIGLVDLISIMTSTQQNFALFRRLRYVKIMNLNLPEKLTNEERISLGQRFRSALDSMPRLEKLDIQNSDLVEDFATLAMLHTPELRTITFKHCPSLTSDGLDVLLMQKGRKLERLVLAGNNSCHGGFLANLSHHCPNLKALVFDLTFRDVTSFHDIDPHWEGSFLPDGMISFPSTLVCLDINNLRKLDAFELEAFLESLIQSDLPNLRSISLKAILGSDFRARARIRNEYGKKLEQRFLRRSPIPTSFSVVIRRIDAAQEPAVVSTSGDISRRHNSRRSRPARKERPSSADQSSDLTAESADRIPMCDVVEFRIDDQRPADNQYAEGDFLDSEASGDDEWRG